MNISDEGLKELRASEGLRLQAYRDTGGVWTIGFGATSYENGEPVKEGDEITVMRAEELLRWHADNTAATPVRRNVKIVLNQDQFDALCSLVYNIGAGAFAKSTLLRKLNEGNVRGAADEFVRWRYVGNKAVRGLFLRRCREMELFIWGRRK